MICLEKKLNSVVTELFIRGRKLNIYLNFIAQSYFPIRKSIIPSSTLYFIMKIPKKRELQQMTFNYTSDIEYEEFMNLNKKHTTKPYYFLVVDTSLGSDNSSSFRKNIKTYHDY